MLNDKLLNLISSELKLLPWQIANTVKLLEEGSTIPFISRYRKEATGELDEVAVQKISERYNEISELLKRKEYISESISSQDKMTADLKRRIEDCWNPHELEDIYLPYKPKRRTRAEIARNNGLEPLAVILMAQRCDNISREAQRYLNENVLDEDSAINGASDIIAEWVSENEGVRNSIRNVFQKTSTISCKVVKGKEDEAQNYKNYFDYSEPLRRCTSHRLLAIRRGEKEGLLKVSIDVDDDDSIDRICRSIVRGNTQSSAIVGKAVIDSYKRLIKPSIENEFAAISKEKADEEAINMFSQNLRQLLFAPPLGHKRVLGVDPGYRTGCKIVCLDAQGNLLHNDTIYPNPPQNDYKTSAKKISTLVESYKIEAIAIGNGTASRETEKFFSSLQYRNQVQIFVVSENGASIYSASKIARDEFPDKDVTVRGSVSIGRRLIDPLAELVKIDPKSIGVGQYQHDVDQTKLKNALNFTVESCVNKVGVNINTASRELLTFVAGLGPQLAQNIVEYRAENGDFDNRKMIMKVPRMGAKAFQQAAGFLRIPTGKNPLDNTAVHPERYPLVERMAKDMHCTVLQLITQKELRQKIVVENYVDVEVGLPTLRDIMDELDKPGLDPRKNISILEFDDTINKFEDVKPGMTMNGIVTNITQFGAFVDFGIKENGLVHISQICDKFISSPSEVLSLHQHVKVKVLEIDAQRRRIALTMKEI